MYILKVNEYNYLLKRKIIIANNNPQNKPFNSIKINRALSKCPKIVDLFEFT